GRRRQILLLESVTRRTPSLLRRIATGRRRIVLRRRISLLRITWRRRITAGRRRHDLRLARPHLLLRARLEIAVVGRRRSRLRDITRRPWRPAEDRAELRRGRRHGMARAEDGGECRGSQQCDG